MEINNSTISKFYNKFREEYGKVYLVNTKQSTKLRLEYNLSIELRIYIQITRSDIVIDGARTKWIDIALLNSIVYYFTKAQPINYRSFSIINGGKRKFQQHQVIIQIIEQIYNNTIQTNESTGINHFNSMRSFVDNILSNHQLRNDRYNKQVRILIIHIRQLIDIVIAKRNNVTIDYNKKNEIISSDSNDDLNRLILAEDNYNNINQNEYYSSESNEDDFNDIIGYITSSESSNNNSMTNSSTDNLNASNDNYDSINSNATNNAISNPINNQIAPFKDRFVELNGNQLNYLNYLVDYMDNQLRCSLIDVITDIFTIERNKLNDINASNNNIQI